MAEPKKNTTSLTALATIELRHDYYRDGRCREMTVSLDPGAAARGVLVRFVDGVLELYARYPLHDLLDRLGDDARKAGLIVHLVPTNPDFFLFTDLPESDGRQGFYIDSSSAETLIGELHPGAMPGQLAVQLRHAGSGLLRLRLDESTDDRRYRIVFKSRETTWRYLVVDPQARKGLEIVDDDGAIGFTAATEKQLPGGRHAEVIESESTIPCSELAAHRFQLVQKSASGREVLVSRLPAASPSSLKREMQDGGKQWVAELYVTL